MRTCVERAHVAHRQAANRLERMQGRDARARQQAHDEERRAYGALQSAIADLRWALNGIKSLSDSGTQFQNERSKS